MAQTVSESQSVAEISEPEPATISGGHLVAKALKAEGIDVIFTLCGGHIIDIYDGCVDEGIAVVDVRHEQVAAHAADGYARMTGKPGCAVVTAGPGMTDAVTGVANAFRAESPMLLIGGQGALNQHKMGSLQDLPHVDMMTPITKFAATVPHTARVADMVSMAFRECYNGAPGPSFLEIPRDILDNSAPVESAGIPEAGRYRASTKSIGDPAGIEALADLLVRAEKPVVLLGTQVWTSRGTDAAIEFVRQNDVPSFMNGSARGTLPPRFVGGALEQFGQKGVAGAILIPSGFAETGEQELQDEVVAIARKHNVRILGPNIYGYYYLPESLCATFCTPYDVKGSVALSSQSGGIGMAILGLAAPAGWASPRSLE
jgi:acetolactate synthase-1/2/3 large subunit